MGADRLVRERDRRMGPEEDGAVIAQAREKPVRIARLDLKVFRGIAVAPRDGLFLRRAEQDRTVTPPRDAGDRNSWPIGLQPVLDLGDRRQAEAAISGDEDGG